MIDEKRHVAHGCKSPSARIGEGEVAATHVLGPLAEMIGLLRTKEGETLPDPLGDPSSLNRIEPDMGIFRLTPESVDSRIPIRRGGDPLRPGIQSESNDEMRFGSGKLPHRARTRLKCMRIGSGGQYDTDLDILPPYITDDGAKWRNRRREDDRPGGATGREKNEQGSQDRQAVHPEDRNPSGNRLQRGAFGHVSLPIFFSEPSDIPAVSLLLPKAGAASLRHRF